jgi:quercetin dioxygenase-like cupin family protein
MESKHFIIGNETSIQDLGEGVSRQILGYNDQLMMVKVIFNKGAIGAIHAHVHSQTTYCPEGSFTFTIGEESRTIKAGDAVYIPSGVLHGVVCLQSGALIDTFNPVRQDFL